MAGTIKGITIEIGGETTKLQSALQKAADKGTAAASEIKKINNALKFNPDNLVLATQKIDALKERVTAAEERLKTLKEAQADVEKQFKEEKISKEVYREFQREVIEAESKLQNFKEQLKKTQDEFIKFEDVFEENAGTINKLKNSYADFKDKVAKAREEHPKLDAALDKSNEIAKKLAIGGLKSVPLALKGTSAAMGAVIAGGVGVVNGLLNISEETKELRDNLGKLETAFTTNNLSAEQSKSAYVDLYAVLGDSDKATEAAAHISAISDSEKDLSDWTNICTGVYGKFGDSLPTEALAEAANETSKTGQLTGALAGALNWAGKSEDEFQSKLDACSTEQERQALITETLNGLYGESAEKYREVNDTIIAAQKAQAEYSLSLADLGGAVEAIKNEALASFMPGITEVVDGLTALLSGEEGAPKLIEKGIEDITKGIGDFVPKIESILGGFTKVVSDLTPEIITVFINGILDNLEPIIDAAFEMLEALVEGLLDEENIEKLVIAAVSLVSNLVEFIGNNMGLIVDSAFVMIDSLINGLLDDENSEKLVKGSLDIVMAIVGGILENAPELIVGAAELIGVLVDEIIHYDWWQVAKDIFYGIIGGFENIASDKKSDGSHAGGIGYVPYNGYNAELHEGERVLTAAQNRNYMLQQQEKTAAQETLSRRLDALETAVNKKTVNKIRVTAVGSARSIVRELKFYSDEEDIRQSAFDD